MRNIMPLVVILLLSCSSASLDSYYDSVAKTAQAQASEAKARYNALMAMADKGDGEALALAVVMAIAMNQTKYEAPTHVPSQGLSWLKDLASSVSSVSAVWVKSDVFHYNDNASTEYAGISRVVYYKVTRQGLINLETINPEIATLPLEVL